MPNALTRIASWMVAKPAAPGRKGVLSTETFQPYAPGFPVRYRDRYGHLNDLIRDRQIYDDETLLSSCIQHDPDVSAAVHGYLSLANTHMLAYAVDLDGQPDLAQSKLVLRDLDKICRQVDYTAGFTFAQSIDQLNADMRFMLLLRGAVMGELILDDMRILLADPASIQWFETTPGNYKPAQRQQGQVQPVSADVPTFFASWYRRDATRIYSASPLIAAINTLAARVGLINDLHRIMQITGFPRVDVTVMEKLVVENAPADIKANADRLKQWVGAQMMSISAQIADMSSEQAFVHPDSVQAKILNEKPVAALNMDSVIKVLNAQNQAGLKTMSTILGRGEAGANTGSVEARLASIYADELNGPVADFWQKGLSFLAHQRGWQGYVTVKFAPAELRPDTELEPQRSLKAARLRQDLSDGLITDFEYHTLMYGRLPHADAPKLSGTGFLTESAGMGDEGTPDPADVNPNKGPLNRAVSPDRTKQTKANPKKVRAGAGLSLHIDL